METETSEESKQPAPVTIAAAQESTAGTLGNLVVNVLPDAREQYAIAKSSGDTDTQSQIAVSSTRAVELNKPEIIALSKTPVDKTTAPALALAAERAGALAQAGGLPGATVATEDELVSPAAINRIAALNNSSISVATMLAKRNAGRSSLFENEVLDIADRLAQSNGGTFPNYAGGADDYVKFAFRWGQEFSRNVDPKNADPEQMRTLTRAVTQAFLSGGTSTERNDALMGLLKANKLGSTPEAKQAMLRASMQGLEDAAKLGEVRKDGTVDTSKGFSGLTATGAGGMVVENLSKYIRPVGLGTEELRHYTADAANNFAGLVRSSGTWQPEHLHVLAEIAAYEAVPQERRMGSLSPRAAKYIEADSAARWAPQQLLTGREKDSTAAPVVSAMVNSIAPVLRDMAIRNEDLPKGVAPADVFRAVINDEREILDLLPEETQERFRQAHARGVEQLTRVLPAQFGISRDEAEVVAYSYTSGATDASLTSTDNIMKDLTKLDAGGMLSAKDGAVKMSPVDVEHYAIQLAGKSTTGAGWTFDKDPVKNKEIQAELLAIAERQKAARTPVTDRQAQIRDVVAPAVVAQLAANKEYMTLEAKFLNAAARGDETQKEALRKQRDVIFSHTMASRVATPGSNDFNILSAYLYKNAGLGKADAFGSASFAALKDRLIALEGEKLALQDGPPKVRVNPAQFAADAAYVQKAYSNALTSARRIQTGITGRLLSVGLNPEKVRASAAKIEAVKAGRSLDQMKAQVSKGLMQRIGDSSISELERLGYVKLLSRVEATNDPNTLASLLLEFDAGLTADELKKKGDIAFKVAEQSAKGKAAGGGGTGAGAPPAPDPGATAEEQAGKAAAE